jgi:hypothetical protein
MINPPLMPHQRAAVDALRNGCILKGGTGSGKTRVGMAYYAEHTAPWVKLYVITTAMKRDSHDWEDEAKLFGCEVVVDSWNNLINYEDVEGAFFIFDEQRVVGSGIWVQAFLRITQKNEWILLSATPGDTWMDYIPVMIANGFYKNRAQFCQEHVVFSRFTKYPKIERIYDTQRLARQLATILVQMPFERRTARHEYDVYVEYDRELFDLVWKQRWHYLEDRPIRNASELFSLMRRVVNSDLSRLARVRDLLVEHPKMIVFYNFDYELDRLRTLNVRKAEWNGHKHEPIPEGDEWIYLVQYSGAEAWNCTTTDTVVFYSLNYSYRASEQAKGRIDRLDTEFLDLFYFILQSGSVIDSAIKTALDKKRNFNETRALKEWA